MAPGKEGREYSELYDMYDRCQYMSSGERESWIEMVVMAMGLFTRCCDSCVDSTGQLVVKPVKV
jgi:hypothetical protein